VTGDGTMTATEKILLVWTLGSAVVLLLIMFFGEWSDLL
jgi:hypothetical protein